jgi:hypothetical protein
MARLWKAAKDPDERLDFFINWEDRLEGDTIETSVWAVDSGSVEIDEDDVIGDITSVWLTGGVLGETCQVRNTITTTEGRIRELTGKLRIQAK